MTAKEFLKDEDYYQVINNKYTQAALINFAKYHVQKALSEASENAKIQWEYVGGYAEAVSVPSIDKDSILNAYPESNIV